MPGLGRPLRHRLRGTWPLRPGAGARASRRPPGTCATPSWSRPPTGWGPVSSPPPTTPTTMWRPCSSTWSGAAGSRASPASRPGGGRLVRPLPHHAPGRDRGLSGGPRYTYIYYASNADPAFARNKLRHQVLPLLRDLNPRLEESLGEAIGRLRADNDYLNAQAANAAREAAWAGRRPGDPHGAGGPGSRPHRRADDPLDAPGDGGAPVRLRPPPGGGGPGPVPRPPPAGWTFPTASPPTGSTATCSSPSVGRTPSPPSLRSPWPWRGRPPCPMRAGPSPAGAPPPRRSFPGTPAAFI